MSLKIKEKKYSKHSAGSLMTGQVPLVSLTDTIATVEKYLKQKKEKLESINYLYVLDKKGRLKGAVSIKEIFRQSKDKKISSFINGKLITIGPSCDSERAANLALEHNIKSVPVVDNDGKFLGVLLSDTILEIAYREIHEDLSRLAGVESVENVKDINSLPTLISLRNRLPWLFIGMLGGFLMSKTISSFESILAQNIILASFIPLIVYIGSAVQTQTGFFIVRDLAFNPKLNFLNYAWRQLKVVALIGLGISMSVFLVAYFLYYDLWLAIILAVAILLAILSSIITGVFIPFIFQRLRLDPASASGPIATIFQDLISIVIYLLVAKSFL